MGPICRKPIKKRKRKIHVSLVYLGAVTDCCGQQSKHWEFFLVSVVLKNHKNKAWIEVFADRSMIQTWKTRSTVRKLVSELSSFTTLLSLTSCLGGYDCQWDVEKTLKVKKNYFSRMVGHNIDVLFIRDILCWNMKRRR